MTVGEVQVLNNRSTFQMRKSTDSCPSDIHHVAVTLQVSPERLAGKMPIARQCPSYHQ